MIPSIQGLRSLWGSDFALGIAAEFEVDCWSTIWYTWRVTSAEALRHAQKAFEEDNYLVREHFEDRLNERLMFWPDVQEVLDAPSCIETDGVDKYGRDRLFFNGMTTGKAEVEILVVFENDGTDSVIFWTIYWNQNGRRRTDKD